MPSLIGPELQCLSSFLLSPGDFGHYFLQEAPFYMGLSDPWDMQDLLQLNQHLDLTYYQSTPLSQNNVRPRKSNLHPLLFKNPCNLSLIFLDAQKLTSNLHDKKQNTKPMNPKNIYIIFLVKIPFKIEDDNPRQFDCISVDL